MEPELVTVFRSADHLAELQASKARDILAETGFTPEIFGDDAPGVPTGAYEVRVPPGEATRADDVIAAHQSEIMNPGDTSEALDLETVFVSNAHNSDLEALNVRGLLEGSGISAVIVGASVYPNLPVEVRVPKAQLDDARCLIEEFQAAGPQVAEEAEAATDDPASEDPK